MHRPITILFDAHPLLGKKTGVGYYTAGLVENLAKIYPEDIKFVGYYHNFLLRKRISGLPEAPNITYRRIAYIPGQVVNLLRRWHIPIPVEILTGKRADFVLYPNFLSAPSLFGTPSAAVVHDLTHIDHPEYASSKNAHDLKKFLPRTITRSNFIITVSEFSKKRIVDIYKINPEKIVTTFIPPSSTNTLSQTTVNQTIASLGITKPFILFMGTLEPRKNLIGLMDAFALLPRELNQKYALVIAGKVDWKSERTIARLAKLQSSGHEVHRLGYVDNDTRTALYRSAELFVLPSFYEGFGMPILEAFSYGLPCAVSDIPPFHEVAGSKATYFNPANAQSIAKAMTSQLSVPRPPLESYTQYLAECPSWKTVCEEIFKKIQVAVSK